jgi:hypothetical protein
MDDIVRATEIERLRGKSDNLMKILPKLQFKVETLSKQTKLKRRKAKNLRRMATWLVKYKPDHQEEIVRYTEWAVLRLAEAEETQAKADVLRREIHILKKKAKHFRGRALAITKPEDRIKVEEKG